MVEKDYTLSSCAQDCLCSGLIRTESLTGYIFLYEFFMNNRIIALAPQPDQDLITARFKEHKLIVGIYHDWMDLSR